MTFKTHDVPREPVFIPCGRQDVNSFGVSGCCTKPEGHEHHGDPYHSYDMLPDANGVSRME